MVKLEFVVSVWVEDVTIFIRELICFLRILFSDNKMEYSEEYDLLDDALDRYIYLRDTGIWIHINDYNDDYFEFIKTEYGTNINLQLWFTVAASSCEGISMNIAEIVNWIMETSDTDLAIEDGGGALNFKRVQKKIYYGKESDFSPWEYVPVKHLDFDREEAFEFTQNDEWVFCSKETIQEMERWRKEQEKLAPSD